ncbi:MAG: tetratricopeptide repeat protein [Pirellulales bacterium]|nr:tetratricopeptide repeat protein [Pirellulales bacterium]
MADFSDTSSSSHTKSKWPERLWIALGVLLLIASLWALLARRVEQLLLREAVTGEVSLALDEVDHIDAPAGALADYNVLVITTDTTRADHIGCYGNRGVDTPVLDRLAAEGILCAHATTPSPSTLPAHSSLLTGLYPHHHGARANGTFRLEDKVTTLAERLKSVGYHTGAVISAFVLDSRFGLDQGFDLYHDDLTKGMKYSPNMFRERAAELTNEPAIEWLKENTGGDKPFFLWVHYFDPHAVYLPPEPFRSEYKHDLYDGEIAYVDSQIGVLLRQLEELGVRDKTLIVYTSDHGEGLGEHGEQTHSMLIYDATMHVPMIINAPADLPQGKIIERQTCLVDVAPTILHLLGKEVPEELDGINLCEKPEEPTRSVLIETIATMTMHGWAPLVGVRRDDYKYILAPTPELYDLSADPRELQNLHDETPNVVKNLGGILADWLSDDPYLAGKQGIDLGNMEVDDEAMRRLAALGYIRTSSDDATAAEERLDPKDQVEHWESVQKAIQLRAQGEIGTAISMLERALAESPGDVFARSILAGAYHQAGEIERALTHYQIAIENESNNPNLLLSLASVLLKQGKPREAEARIEQALEMDPEAAEAYMLRGQIALQRSKPEEALHLYHKALEMDPGTIGPGAYNSIGMLHLIFGRFDEARDAFNNAIRLDSLNGTAHDGLANILIHQGRIEQAMRELQIALRFDPNQARALTTLASLLSQRGDQQKALEVAQRALRVAPKLGILHNNLGLIYRRTDQLELAEKHYKLAIEYDPRQDAPHVNLAQLYRKQGKEEESISQFRAAIKASPYYPNPIALANLGVYHFNKQEIREALTLYVKALQVDPDYALVHRYIASIYSMPDYFQPQRIIYHLQRTLELDPDQEGADRLRELLKKAEAERDEEST